jgi:hypothetical protein
VFELLKRHLFLEVPAIAMIVLDDCISGSQIRLFDQGIPVAVSGDVMSHVHRTHY